jgi:hypothetical protein
MGFFTFLLQFLCGFFKPFFKILFWTAAADCPAMMQSAADSAHSAGISRSGHSSASAGFRSFFMLSWF